MLLGDKVDKKLIYLTGIIFLSIGIFLSIFFKEPHFYSFFSVGLFLILFQAYNSIAKKPLFEKWKIKHFTSFFFILIISCIIIDKLGIYFNYWDYPHYSGILDDIIKYIFEWGVAFLYFMLSLMIGIEILHKLSINKKISFILSLIFFVTIIGLFSEYINLSSYSWRVLSMLISNYQIGKFFIVFQTIGYWLMALIPFSIYKFVDALKKETGNKFKNRKIKKMNKKAQQEIVGFVVIVIIVCVIGLIFLSLMIGRGEPESQSSVEASDLLKSSIYYTSECKINFEYENMQELIKSCYKTEKCSGGKTACDYLNLTFIKIIDESMSIGENFPNKAYKLYIYYKDMEEINPNEEILKIEKGIFSNCSSRIGGNYFIPVVGLKQGTINLELNVCKNK